MNQEHLKKGGKVFDAGSYGCTFKPALKCNNSIKRRSGISKLLDNKEANNEWNKLMQIKKIINNIPNNKNYFLLDNLEKCTPNKLVDNDFENIEKCKNPLSSINNIFNINNELNKVKIINMPDGGTSLYNIFSNRTVELDKINKILINLLQHAIIPMNKLGIYHNDLKSDNVLYKNNNIRIIDWGLAMFRNKNNTIPNILLNRSLTFNTPFSKILFAPDLLNKFKKYNLKQCDPKKLYLKLFYILQDYYDIHVQYIGKGHQNFLINIIETIISINTSNLSNYNVLIILKNIVASYCAKVLLKYYDFTTDKLDMDKYFTELYSKNTDIHGFILCYLDILFIPYSRDMINYNIEKNRKICLANIIIKYIFSNSYADKLINIESVIVDLSKLTNNDYLKTPVELNFDNFLSTFSLNFGMEKIKSPTAPLFPSLPKQDIIIPPKSIVIKPKSDIFKPKKTIKVIKQKHKPDTKKLYNIKNIFDKLFKPKLVKKGVKDIVPLKKTKKKVKDVISLKKYCPRGTRKKYYCESKTKLYRYKYNKRCPRETRKMGYCRRKKS